MPMYLVTWMIDFDADTPEEAAALALMVMRDNSPDNTATVFTVQEHNPAEGGYLDPVWTINLSPEREDD